MKPTVTVALSEPMVYNNIIEENLAKYAPEIKVVGKAGTLEDLLDVLEKNKPDVLLLCLEIKTKDVIDFFGLIKKKYPDLKIIISTLDLYADFLKHYYLNRDADGYIHSNCFGDKFELLIDAIFRAKNSLKTTCSHLPGDRYHELTRPSLDYSPEEYDIMTLITLSIKESAKKLKMKESEVRKHRMNMFQKTGVKSKLSFYVFAASNGLFHVVDFKKK